MSEEKEVQETPKEEVKKSAPTGVNADLISKIEALSVKDLAELVKELEDRFGVSAAAPVAADAAGAAPAEVGADEKSDYSIMLTEAGSQKIAVIKAVREVRPDLGLKEAKDLVDGAPKEIKAGVPADEAKSFKEKLEAAGAKVELK